MIIILLGRREKRGSWDSSCTTSSGYETISKYASTAMFNLKNTQSYDLSHSRVSGDAVCVVENPSSQITMLTEVSQEKDKEMDDQHVNQPNKVAVCITFQCSPQ